jgi:Uma2 family endonuclease
MGVPHPKPTLEHFLAWENEQAERHFYYRGEIFAMVGVRQAHAHASGNIYAALKSALRGTPCCAFIADMKLLVEGADMVFYPDVMVSCDARDRATPLHLSHPKLVIEVLSESTASYDRGIKFVACRRIDTLEEYVLVDLEARRIEVFRKNAEGLWVLYEFSGAQFVTFASVGITLDADTIYENVEEG